MKNPFRIINGETWDYRLFNHSGTVVLIGLSLMALLIVTHWLYGWPP